MAPETQMATDIVNTKDYKSVYRLSSKIKDKGFEADLYTKR